MSGPPWTLGEARVVDLSGIAGAYGTRIWAALGAEVIKVEPPGGSALRNSNRWLLMSPTRERAVVGLLRGGHPQRGDRPDHRRRPRQLAALLASADVVIDDALPTTRTRTRSGDATATLAANPGCVWVSITPFGLTGPQRCWRSNDFIGWASCGLTKTLGFPDRPPLGPAPKMQLGMHITALNAVTAAMLALRARRRTGRGQIVDLSVQECLLAVAPETGVPLYLDDQVPRPRAGNRRPVTSPFGIFRLPPTASSPCWCCSQRTGGPWPSGSARSATTRAYSTRSSTT